MPTSKRILSDQERKDRTRQTLLDAAGRVFVAKGYHRALISDIVAEAGVGQGTFYRFFDSKREIFETLMTDVFESSAAQFADMSARLPANAREYRDASLSAIQRIAAMAEAHRELILVFLREGPTIDADMAAVIDAGLAQFASLARHYLDHAIASGFARPCDSAVVAQAIVGMGLRTIELWGSRTPGDIPLADMIREMVDFAFYGLVGKPPSGKGRRT